MVTCVARGHTAVSSASDVLSGSENPHLGGKARRDTSGRPAAPPPLRDAVGTAAGGAAAAGVRQAGGGTRALLGPGRRRGAGGRASRWGGAARGGASAPARPPAAREPPGPRGRRAARGPRRPEGRSTRTRAVPAGPTRGGRAMDEPPFTALERALAEPCELDAALLLDIEGASGRGAGFPGRGMSGWRGSASRAAPSGPWECAAGTRPFGASRAPGRATREPSAPRWGPGLARPRPAPVTLARGDSRSVPGGQRAPCAPSQPGALRPASCALLSAPCARSGSSAGLGQLRYALRGTRIPGNKTDIEV